MATVTDIRVLVPRIRRAVEGVVQAQWSLTDDQVKDLAADAIADVILYVGSFFGKSLDVTHVDSVTGAPDEYATSDAISLAEQGVIASQAALNFFFFKFAGLKVSEKMADEASSWEYALSPNLLVAQMRLLVEQRDKALDALEAAGVIDEYVSFIAIRDTQTSRMIEPWVYGHSEGIGVGAGGLEGDYRFGVGGGDYT